MTEFIGMGLIKNLRLILKKNIYKKVFYIIGNSRLEKSNIFL